MIATLKQTDSTSEALAVADADKAISLANRWLHRHAGMLIHVSHATFDSATCSWHLPVEFAYPRTGLLGVIGDIFLNAADGQFIGLPPADELRQRATALARAYGFTDDDDDDDDDAARLPGMRKSKSGHAWLPASEWRSPISACSGQKNGYAVC